MENCLDDVLDQLVEDVQKLKSKPVGEFEKGVIVGLYESISVLLNRAESFGLTEKLAVKWHDFRPEAMNDDIKKQE